MSSTWRLGRGPSSAPHQSRAWCGSAGQAASEWPRHPQVLSITRPSARVKRGRAAIGYGAAFLISLVLAGGCRRSDTGQGTDVSPTHQVSQASHATRDSDFAKCATQGQDGPCTDYNPSLMELVSRPEWYDGHRVLIIGVLRYGFESAGLHASSEAYQQRLTRSAVSLAGTKSCPDCPKWQGRWVTVVGTYRASDRGHMGLFGGTIDEVTAVRLYDVEDHLRQPATPKEVR